MIKKKALKIILCLIGILFCAISYIALQIYLYGDFTSAESTDAAVVLGAAVWGEELSPVFTERVNHSLNLYRSGKVRKIIFTGGQGNRDELTESAAARLYALEHGIPEDIILIEEKSHDTHENLFYAKEVADDNQLKTVLIVSDPLHMKRAMIMAEDLGLKAYPSPTATTKYQSIRSQTDMLAQETYHYIRYLVKRSF